jgi:hypothetical protein
LDARRRILIPRQAAARDRIRVLDLVTTCGVMMAMRTLLWRGLDAPRMEIVRAESLDRAAASGEAPDQPRPNGEKAPASVV